MAASTTNEAISFVIPLKNRTCFTVRYREEDVVLRLFENNMRQLASLFDAASDTWEVVVVDYCSTDVADLRGLLASILPEKVVITFISVGDPLFNRGRARNVGWRAAQHDVIFFLDADMEIRTRKLLEDVQEHVVRNDAALFPICYSYRNPQHTTGYKRASGTGNVIISRARIPRAGFPEYSSWGNEDGHFYKSVANKVRTYYGSGFVHQWHPNHRVFKDRYVRSKDSKVAQKAGANV